MCLKNISSKSKSDGSAVMYKVFIHTVAREDSEKAFLVSPFEYTPLTDDILGGKAEYAADRRCLPESLFDETSVMLRGKISDGFVHGYADKRSALKDLYRFYATKFAAAALIKCRIPEGEVYYDGDFDNDETVRVRATRAVTVERIEEMYVDRMTEEDHERYGDYHMFVRKNQSPRRCVAFLKRMYGKTDPRQLENDSVITVFAEYMSPDENPDSIPDDSIPDLYNQ